MFNFLSGHNPIALNGNWACSTRWRTDYNWWRWVMTKLYLRRWACVQHVGISTESPAAIISLEMTRSQDAADKQLVVSTAKCCSINH